MRLLETNMCSCTQLTEQAEVELMDEFERLAIALEQRKKSLLHKLNSLRTSKGGALSHVPLTLLMLSVVKWIALRRKQKLFAKHL